MQEMLDAMDAKKKEKVVDLGSDGRHALHGG